MLPSIYCHDMWRRNYNPDGGQSTAVSESQISSRSTGAQIRALPTVRIIVPSSHIMTIYSLHDYFTGIFVYKSLNNDLPLSLCNIFFRNTSERSSHNLRSVYHRKKSTQFSIKIVGTKIWNNLSRECKQCVDLNHLKKCCTVTWANLLVK